MTYRVNKLRAYDRGKLLKGYARKPRYLEVVPPCWLCNTSDRSTATKEHVLGQWTRKHFTEDQLIFEPHRAHIGGLRPGEFRGPMTTSALVAGGVCATCNNGWMSDLEGAVEKMVFEEREAWTAEESMVFARWLAKTAVIVNVSQTFPLAWPSADRHVIQRGLPHRVRVSLFRVEGSDMNWLQGDIVTGTSPNSIPPEKSVAFMSLMHVARIRIHNLVGVVVRLPWQLSPASIYAPGRPIWDGAESHSVQLDELPQLDDWRDDQVSIHGEESSFFAQPDFNDVFLPGPIQSQTLHHSEPTTRFRRPTSH